MCRSTNVTNPSEVLLIGEGRSIASIVACLVLSGSRVTIVGEEHENTKQKVHQHLEDFRQYSGEKSVGSFRIMEDVPSDLLPSLAIITGYSELTDIRSAIHFLEHSNTGDLIITVATDHIPLSAIQHQAMHPENILVMNWSEPAHTTFFLEIVYNVASDPHLVSRLKNIGIDHWGKDPYVVKSELGVRGRLETAVFREAMYLIEEGYANVEDIDRACRNDGGTYLPFAGNFQYMDLMGTYAYGLVMERLNRELSRSTDTSPYFDQVFSATHKGMTDGKGFYTYTQEESDEWEIKMRKFSFEIRDLMNKYPNNYIQDDINPKK